MKFKFLTFIISSGFFLFQNMAQASDLPDDLKDLADRWHKITMTDSAHEMMSMNLEVLGGPIEGHGSLVFDKEYSNLDINLGSSIRSIKFVEVTKDVRKSVLKSIFSKGDQSLSFCKSYPLVELKFKEGSEVTEDERKLLETRANHSRCRKETENILSGILFANPRAYVFSTKLGSDVEKEKVVVYVRSMINKEQYLRYSFILS